MSSPNTNYLTNVPNLVVNLVRNIPLLTVLGGIFVISKKMRQRCVKMIFQTKVFVDRRLRNL